MKQCVSATVVRMRSAEFMLGRWSRIHRQDERQDAVAKDQQRMAVEAEHKSAMMAKDPSSELCGNTWSSPETSVEKISREPKIVDPEMKNFQQSTRRSKQTLNSEQGEGKLQLAASSVGYRSTRIDLTSSRIDVTYLRTSRIEVVARKVQ